MYPSTSKNLVESQIRHKGSAVLENPSGVRVNQLVELSCCLCAQGLNKTMRFLAWSSHGRDHKQYPAPAARGSAARRRLARRHTGHRFTANSHRLANSAECPPTVELRTELLKKDTHCLYTKRITADMEEQRRVP